jgi:hypothetical protein
MTDYFALFDQPRRPWLDPHELKQKYHALARAAQPDEKVNEAYRVLSDPKLRLQHLLALAGATPPGALSEVPAELAALFMQIAPILNHRDAGRNGSEVAGQVAKMMEKALAELRELDSAWLSNLADNILPQLESLHRRISYLSRWENLLREHALAEEGGI